MHRTPRRRPGFAIGLIVILLCTSIASTTFAEKLSFLIQLPRENVTVLTDAGVATIQVSAAGYDLLAEEGSPELPYRIISVLLPQGDTVESFRFTADGPVLTMLRRAAIAQAGPMVAEDGTVGRGEPLAAASDAGTVFPEALGRYLGTSYLHGRAIASFAVFPVRVDSGDLVLTEKVTVEITTTLATDVPVVRERFREGFQKSVESMLEAFVVNPEMNGRYMFDEVAVEKEKGGFQPTTYPSLEGSPVDYLDRYDRRFGGRVPASRRLENDKGRADGGADGGVDRGKYAQRCRSPGDDTVLYPGRIRQVGNHIRSSWR